MTLFDEFIAEVEAWNCKDTFAAWLRLERTPDRINVRWLRQKWEEFLDWAAGDLPEEERE